LRNKGYRNNQFDQCPEFDKWEMGIRDPLEQLISSRAPNTHCYRKVIANDNMT
jgi:hypothetical protein